MFILSQNVSNTLEMYLLYGILSESMQDVHTNKAYYFRMNRAIDLPSVSG